MEKENSDYNKSAWEHLVYEWRVKQQGFPEEVAEKIKEDPKGFLRYHANQFKDLVGKNIASVCGSDGRRAVALGVLGASCTVFDISEPQKKYALSLANAAGVDITYELNDFCKIDMKKYGNCFDYVYCEGGILHYFEDLQLFFKTVSGILKIGGVLILSDYHPFQKTLAVNPPVRNIDATKGDYFERRIHDGHVPYAKYFSKEEQARFPKCKLRFYTLSEIINSLLGSGLTMTEFQEHPKRNNKKIPGEFTIIAIK